MSFIIYRTGKKAREHQRIVFKESRIIFKISKLSAGIILRDITQADAPSIAKNQQIFMSFISIKN